MFNHPIGEPVKLKRASRQQVKPSRTLPTSEVKRRTKKPGEVRTLSSKPRLPKERAPRKGSQIKGQEEKMEGLTLPGGGKKAIKKDLTQTPSCKYIISPPTCASRDVLKKHLMLGNQQPTCGSSAKVLTKQMVEKQGKKAEPQQLRVKSDSRKQKERIGGRDSGLERVSDGTFPTGGGSESYVSVSMTGKLSFTEIKPFIQLIITLAGIQDNGVAQGLHYPLYLPLPTLENNPPCLPQPWHLAVQHRTAPWSQ
ncbi:hypothetical protein MG293_018233 [Ovis ammon polii]|uniref:Uncharacterized protein n=1 Tax=Ovis ammon polii TaxID=230172 RepID=A0AAD4TSS3_OVIAM|nr:hypothetical protein MG293_018233 [Ovis ammon polii]